MKSKVLLILTILTMLIFAGCTSNDIANQNKENNQEVKTGTTEKKDDKKINIVFRDGIPALTMAHMMSNEDLSSSINYDMVASADVLTSKVLNKEADFAIVPSNFSAIAHNKGAGYKIVGTSVWGNAYILTNDESIKSVADLKGKTVTLFAKGLTPDLMTKFVLSSNEIDPEKDLTLEYLSSPTEIAPAFLTDKASVVLAPEPMATAIILKNEKAVRLVNLNEEVKKFGLENGYPQATLIVKEELIQNDKQLVDDFIKNYEESIKWASENKKELADLSEAKELGIKKGPVLKGFDNMNIGNFELKSKDDYNKYFEVLNKYNPQSIGGKIPGAEAYYEK